MFESWQVALISVGSSALLSWITWFLNRRQTQRTAAVESDSVVVDTITDVMTEMRADLVRLRAEVAEAHIETQRALTTIRYIADELDHASRMLAAHRVWDEAHMADGAPEAPPLPILPRYWEIMSKVRNAHPGENAK